MSQAPGKAGRCKGCNAAIVWGTTAATGAYIPLEAVETTVMFSFSKEYSEKFRNMQVVKGYIPHHINCPKADEFRRAR